MFSQALHAIRSKLVSAKLSDHAPVYDMDTSRLMLRHASRRRTASRAQEMALAHLERSERSSCALCISSCTMISRLARRFLPASRTLRWPQIVCGCDDQRENRMGCLFQAPLSWACHCLPPFEFAAGIACGVDWPPRLPKSRKISDEIVLSNLAIAQPVSEVPSSLRCLAAAVFS